MARYQVLYWEYIPIGVKATDATGTVRKNLPPQFQDAFEKAVTQNRSNHSATYTTSGFHWSQEQVRGGNAAEVAASIVKDLIETWNEAQALASFEQENTGPPAHSPDRKQF
jgi:hypothetical protein